jgi:serine protease Do
MKKLIIGFVIGVMLTVPVMMAINQPETPVIEPMPTPQVVYVTPSPVPIPTPQVIYEERLTDLETVVANTKDSCVMIYAHMKDGSIEQGSGWAYNGYIVTAKHVVEGAAKVIVFLDNLSGGIPSDIEYIDDNYDVAVLKIGRDIPSVKLGDSSKLKEGEKLIAITSPAGNKNSIDECVYSGMAVYGAYSYLTVSESEMIGGSSGGAIFNSNSELIGMNVEGSKGVNGAIPINTIKSILEKATN